MIHLTNLDRRPSRLHHLSLDPGVTNARGFLSKVPARANMGSVKTNNAYTFNHAEYNLVEHYMFLRSLVPFLEMQSRHWSPSAIDGGLSTSFVQVKRTGSEQWTMIVYHRLLRGIKPRPLLTRVEVRTASSRKPCNYSYRSDARPQLRSSAGILSLLLMCMTVAQLAFVSHNHTIFDSRVLENALVRWHGCWIQDPKHLE